jgi:hemolysin activation/secretion protein
MKALILIAMTLSISSTVFAADLNQNALATLLTTKNLSVSGDVHSDETFKSIYGNAVKNGAKISNECIVTSAETAKCTLYLAYELGETAVQYSVYLPGNQLVSTRLDVSRGD